MGYSTVDRRGFIKLGAATLASGAVLEACGGAAAGANAGSSAAAKPPTFSPRKGVPTPQLPGSDILTAGYLEAPQPFNAYKGKPMKGGSISYFGVLNGPPIPGRGQNKWWQAIEAALGGTITSDLVASSAYQEKAQALIAANDYPDLFQIQSVTEIPQLQQLLESKFVDLAPYVSGDKVKEYPNLANIPTQFWVNSEVGGRIWGVPTPRPLQNNAPVLYRKDLAQQAGLALPKNKDDLTKWLKALTTTGRWGMQGDSDSHPYSYEFFMQMWGLPNNWKVSGGKFTNWVEMPEVKEALDYMISLRKAGVMAPYSTLDELKDQMAAGTVALYSDTFTGVPGDVTSTFTANPHSPVQAVDVIIPFGPDGGKAVSWNSPGYVSLAAAFSKSSKVSVEERLRVCDWHAAPAFSIQANLNNNGIKGVHYTEDANGVITPTALGTAEAGGVILNYISAPPFVYWNQSSARGQWTTRVEYNGSVQASKIGIDDPSLRLYSPTFLAQGATLNSKLFDTIRSVVSGHQPLSTWDTFVQQWKSGGGDKMRSEFEKALAKPS